MRSRLAYLSGLVTLVIFLGCSSDLAPVDFDPDAFPSAPLAVTVMVGDGVVALSWSHASPQQIDFYRIYRRTSRDTSFLLVDSTSAMAFTDSPINNEVAYVYGVSAVRAGLEGPRALSSDVVPTVFGVIINERAEFTRSRNVILTLIAPANTSFMRISNSEVLAGSVWEPFRVTKSWTITEQDGVKRVFVSYRDGNGNQTVQAARDSIVLDTKAAILSVSENTNGESRSAGETILFSMQTAEKGGEASVDLGTVRRVRLFDDGTNGDDVEGDGVYNREFQIPFGLEMISASVIGRFTDQIGNVAEPVEASGRITIQDPPRAVALNTPEVLDETVSLQLTWTRSDAGDFASYKIYRAISAGVSTASALVATLSSASTLSYLDQGLEAGTTYYYRVYVFDNGGLSTGSNEVSATTASNQPPDPVALAQPDQTDSTSFRLSWSRSRADDFASYRIYRSEGVPVNLSDAPISIISESETTSFDDLNLERGVDYYYIVLVFDTGGLSAASNEVMGRLR